MRKYNKFIKGKKINFSFEIDFIRTMTMCQDQNAFQTDGCFEASCLCLILRSVVFQRQFRGHSTLRWTKGKIVLKQSICSVS